MPPSFQLSALSADRFRPLFDADPAELARHGAVRVVADSEPGYPCRVSLRDARVGERLLLLPHTHQPADSPYRASGPIFVRIGAEESHPAPGELPAYITSRDFISVRAYGDDDCLRQATVCAGSGVAGVIGRLWADDGVAYLHLHNAAWGCYLARVDRA